MATASVKRSASTDSKRSHSGHRYEKVAAKLRDPRLQRERCSPGASQLRPPTRPILQYHQRTPTAMKTPIPCFPPPSPPVDIYVAPTMERTLSGHSIVSDHNISMPPPVIHDHTILSDDQAANLIEHHFRYDPPPDHYYLEVELQNLLLKAHLSDRAIDRIIYLVDTIFFHNSLHNRVRLSCSLLFICKMWAGEAKQMGGHTDGFHRVVGVIDAWVERWIGRDWLRLCSMRANLEFFRVHTEVCVPLSRGVGEERRTSAWEDNGNGNGNGEVRERERSWGIHHHGHHRHSGCGQSPGPGTERALRFSRDFIPYVGDEEGFR
ncbi:hypothetical protein SS1G_12181 [Sclerotinia sclerotiorum 1980 UF-70]|uniref:Uncharacterized protein n=1 Tax=Sclerotinia sclerotiorum (strain ATCC 18683 / 1980 / Ss-1) TaxID=665079 RepID=A7F2N3_SCLS1|nr:hypothetical protein SS1G_12181 [Sclerotinia sclerotiorum 1980 UF-70]EDN95975.1 hypothetical protein SS1G_12181 [Sclerotinia sclerotiorum 1980 UF-70]